MLYSQLVELTKKEKHMAQMFCDLMMFDKVLLKKLKPSLLGFVAIDATIVILRGRDERYENNKMTIVNFLQAYE